jgi:primosomal protein N' (replication factor Y)
MECRSCGYSPTCPDCAELRMVLHRKRLICHHCGLTELVPTRCPKCGSESLDPDGIAIQKLEEEIRALVPDAPVMRLDRDVTAGRREELQVRLTAFRRDGGVLLGTQMIAKGHDFPAVTLAIAADSDVGTSSPDFRSNERTFQTLTQAAGRCGRDLLGGQVLLQTRSPDSPLLERVRNHDYVGFAAQELEMRKELGLPPWSRLFLVEAASRTASRAEAILHELAASIQAREGLQVLGPIPAPLPVVRQSHRFHLVIRCLTSQPGIRPQLARWLGSLKDPELRCHVDVDPVDLL